MITISKFVARSVHRSKWTCSTYVAAKTTRKYQGVEIMVRCSAQNRFQVDDEEGRLSKINQTVHCWLDEDHLSVGYPMKPKIAVGNVKPAGT